MLSRFTSLSTLGLALGAALLTAGSASAQSPAPITTTRITSGLTLPLYVTAPVGDTSRIFVVEQRAGTIGRIRTVSIPGNVLDPTPYLSVSPVATGNEQGLLGLAFHPNFATNGYFYVDYTNSAGNTIIARYQANAPFTTSNTANAGSALQILTIAQPFSNHNGGWIAFGPDGYLYIAMGDGGSANDPNSNGQNINVLLGKILRINVDTDDFPGDATKNYGIPSTNPFAGATPGADEIWFYGMRNPWRDSFDRQTGDLWLGDVGQNAVEEVDFAPAGQGGLNFGWKCVEGTSNTNYAGCTYPAPGLLPVQTYNHTGGNCSITGGYRYRGTALCGWNGTYFYGDYCTSTLWSFGFNGTNITNFANRTAQLAPAGFAINNPTSFGEDANGELYICDQGGEIFKIVPSAAITDCNGNGIHDGCDISSGTSVDANNDGIPDECQSTITPYCFGDGTGTACPCANNGAAGNGCANSVNASGANLSASGQGSVSNDSLLLIGAGMPSSSALYFQGTTQQAGGAGSVFGDGKRCAAGSVIRLATKTNVAGQSQYPEILDTQISIKGAITGGPTTRTYQIWYRNAAAFCNVETYNLTNGLSVVWVN